MGVMYDYFAAPSEEAAAATIDWVGGPGTPPPLPMPFRELVAKYGLEEARTYLKPRLYLSESGLYVVSTKGFDAITDLGAVESQLTGVSLDDILDRDDPVVADRDGGERRVLRIGDATRDALVHATDDAMVEAARRWAASQSQWRTIELEPIVHLLGQLAALARVATKRGEGLFCWICV